MKYPALITKQKDGKFTVTFPDFTGGEFGLVEASGNTLWEAEQNAEKAIRSHIKELCKDCTELHHFEGKYPIPLTVAINIKV